MFYVAYVFAASCNRINGRQVLAKRNTVAFRYNYA